jgi:serine/threonine-protein kinase
MSDVSAKITAALSDRYRIERELGAGGMATVYLAEDVRHHRKVALKVLKPELAAVLGAERFVQEIRTTAALQHPHILPLFDSGEADSFLYYVMPYIEGETLRERLDREKQLGIEEAVRLTTDIADALDYAHGQNVIHRDIKPENILLHNARPMVADFGIALAVSAAAGGRMTETGLSLGTPHYMSPEQATADKDLTSRSDIYSLGAMLYEMLTGDPPHTGSTAQQVIAKIVTEDPAPVTKARKSVPPNVAAAVATALEKLPADRFVSAKAFADALADAGFHTTTTGARLAGSRAGPARQTMWRGAAIAASLLALGAVAFGLWAWQRRPAMPTVRLSVAFPPGQQMRPAATRRFALSRDGSRMVYVGQDSVGGSQLWVRDLNSLTGRPLAGTSGALGPFFSPDGESVGYFTGSIGDLRVVSVRGGAPRTLVRDSVLAFGGSWCDGEIYFTAGPAAGARVSERGGAYELISRPDRATGVAEHDWLQCLPERGVVLAQLWRSAFTNADLALIDIEGGVVTPLVQGVYGRYVPSGHLLYVTVAGTLYRVPLDLGQRRVTDQPVIVADGVQLDPTSGSAQFDVSDNGILAYLSGGGEGTDRVVWVDRAGRQTPVDSGWHGQFTTAELSPDDGRVALSQFRGGELQVAVKDLPAGPLSRLSAGGLAADRPAWTPDGPRGPR